MIQSCFLFLVLFFVQLLTNTHANFRDKTPRARPRPRLPSAGTSSLVTISPQHRSTPLWVLRPWPPVLDWTCRRTTSFPQQRPAPSPRKATCLSISSFVLSPPRHQEFCCPLPTGSVYSAPERPHNNRAGHTNRSAFTCQTQIHAKFEYIWFQGKIKQAPA